VDAFHLVTQVDKHRSILLGIQRVNIELVSLVSNEKHTQ